MNRFLPLVILGKALALTALFLLVFLGVVSMPLGHPLASCYDYLISDPAGPTTSNHLGVKVERAPLDNGDKPLLRGAE